MTPTEEAAQESAGKKICSAPAEDNRIEEASSSSSTCAKNAFRVKRVSEINGNTNKPIGDLVSNLDTDSSAASASGKRKLPTWMSLAAGEVGENVNEASCSKKSKIIAHSDINGDVSTTNPNAAEADCLANNEEPKADSAENANPDNPTRSSAAKTDCLANDEEPEADSAENTNPDNSTSYSAAETDGLTKCEEPEIDSAENTNPDNATSNCAAETECQANDEELDSVRDPVCSTTCTVAQVKVEPTDTEATCTVADPVADTACASSSNPVDVKPAVNVKKEEATSTSRESCKFGVRCYRRNPMHRIEEAHPGDHDYKRPNFPAPPLGTPDCPFGDRCYRRNPTHFEQFSHPSDTDFELNWRNYRKRLRPRQQNTSNNSSTNDNDAASGNSSDFDDYDLDDPFIDDGDQDADYVPSEAEDNEEHDYDDCDKAEE